MAGTERAHRPIDPPRPGGGGSGEAGGGDSPARWDDDGERVEGLAVSSPTFLPSPGFVSGKSGCVYGSFS